jgi:hypothetical protein
LFFKYIILKIHPIGIMIYLVGSLWMVFIWWFLVQTPTPNIAQQPILFTLKLRHKNGVFNLVK